MTEEFFSWVHKKNSVFDLRSEDITRARSTLTSRSWHRISQSRTKNGKWNGHSFNARSSMDAKRSAKMRSFARNWPVSIWTPSRKLTRWWSICLPNSRKTRSSLRRRKTTFSAWSSSICSTRPEKHLRKRRSLCLWSKRGSPFCKRKRKTWRLVFPIWKPLLPTPRMRSIPKSGTIRRFPPKTMLSRRVWTRWIWLSRPPRRSWQRRKSARRYGLPKRILFMSRSLNWRKSFQNIRTSRRILPPLSTIWRVISATPAPPWIRQSRHLPQSRIKMPRSLRKKLCWRRKFLIWKIRWSKLVRIWRSNSPLNWMRQRHRRRKRSHPNGKRTRRWPTNWMRSRQGTKRWPPSWMRSRQRTRRWLLNWMRSKRIRRKALRQNARRTQNLLRRTKRSPLSWIRQKHRPKKALRQNA